MCTKQPVLACPSTSTWHSDRRRHVLSLSLSHTHTHRHRHTLAKHHLHVVVRSVGAVLRSVRHHEVVDEYVPLAPRTHDDRDLSRQRPLLRVRARVSVQLRSARNTRPCQSSVTYPLRTGRPRDEVRTQNSVLWCSSPGCAAIVSTTACAESMCRNSTMTSSDPAQYGVRKDAQPQRTRAARRAASTTHLARLPSASADAHCSYSAGPLHVCNRERWVGRHVRREGREGGRQRGGERGW
jgi:hypothetical protein